MKQFLVLSISALVLFAGGSAWLALYPGVPRDLDGAPDLDRVARRVRIPIGADSLDGWALEGRRRAVVIAFHGYGRDHTRAWRYASFLRRAGYGFVTVDFRSSRASERKPTTLGAYELPDAEATLAWVERAPEYRGARIGLLGESLGGSVALVLAARHPRIAAVVADCPFSTGRRAIEDATERWAHLPRRPFAAIVCAGGRLATGCDPCALDAIAATESLKTRPLLFIHSTRDDRFAPEQARDLWRTAGAKDEIWLVDVGHNVGWQYRRDEYERRVLAFFDRNLKLGALPSAGAAVAADTRRAGHAVSSGAKGAAKAVGGLIHREKKKP